MLFAKLILNTRNYRKNTNNSLNNIFMPVEPPKKDKNKLQKKTKLYGKHIQQSKVKLMHRSKHIRKKTKLNRF